MRGWTDECKYTIKTIHGLKGAAFVMACITDAEKCEGIDMLMYYDTRPSAFCGAFDFYTYEPLKTYYALNWYGKFYDCDAEIRCETEAEDIYTLCGVDKEGKALCIITNYSDNDKMTAKDIKIDFGKNGKYEVYIVDEENDGELIGITDKLEFTIKPWSFILIKEI